MYLLLQEDALRRKESEIRSLNEELSNTRRKMTDLEHEKSNLNVSFFEYQSLISEIDFYSLILDDLFDVS